MDTRSAQDFARQWVEAWNSHDLKRILSHFTDDVIFTSPLATRILPESGGTVVGKAALGEYWREGLRLIPELHFVVEGVYVGVDAVVINYRNQSGRLVCEVLMFEGDLVCQGTATYCDEVVGDT